MPEVEDKHSLPIPVVDVAEDVLSAVRIQGSMPLFVHDNLWKPTLLQGCFAVDFGPLNLQNGHGNL